jgi:menaquinone-dependent protoporphyrinogen IX oxidase
MIPSLFTILSVIISLSTASSVILHDTRLDKIATVAVATPIMYAHYETGFKPFLNDAHTHVERSAFSQVLHAYQSAAPGIQPRHERKHLLQKHVPKGHHAFDNYNLPIV